MRDSRYLSSAHAAVGLPAACGARRSRASPQAADPHTPLVLRRGAAGPPVPDPEEAEMRCPLPRSPAIRLPFGPVDTPLSWRRAAPGPARVQVP